MAHRPLLLSLTKPISFTILLSMVYEQLVSSSLRDFIESEGVFSSYQYDNRKGLEQVMSLRNIVWEGMAALDHES